MDRITIKSLTFKARHGYYEEERVEGNWFEVDLIAHGNFKKAIDENDLNKTFNYETATSIVADIMEGPAEKLIETLCSKIGNRLMEKEPAICLLEVVVRKLSPPIQVKSEYAEISMKWSRRL